MRPELHPAAREELAEEASYYERRIPNLGESFIDAFESALALIQEHPRLGLRIDHVFRHLPLRRFPHSLIYNEDVGRIWVVAVAHQKRRPGYWRERLSRPSEPSSNAPTKESSSPADNNF